MGPLATRTEVVIAFKLDGVAVSVVVRQGSTTVTVKVVDRLVYDASLPIKVAVKVPT
jgi:hypothetical protein